MAMNLVDSPCKFSCYIWQSKVKKWDGGIYQPQEVYYSAEKALEVEKERVRVVIGYE